MTLGWEIDDVTGADELACVEHEHVSRPDLLVFASRRVLSGVFGKCLLELQGESASHHAHAVNWIHQSLGIFGKYVAGFLVERGWLVLCEYCHAGMISRRIRGDILCGTVHTLRKTCSNRIVFAQRVHNFAYVELAVDDIGDKAGAVFP